MSKVERIEAEISKLKPADVRRVAKWLADYEAKLWGKQMQKDASEGRLEFLFDEADAERRAGKLRDWPSENT